MRSARRCQPASAFVGQRTCADAFTESLAPQPASATAASATITPARFTAPLKPGNRHIAGRDASEAGGSPSLPSTDEPTPILGSYEFPRRPPLNSGEHLTNLCHIHPTARAVAFGEAAPPCLLASPQRVGAALALGLPLLAASRFGSEKWGLRRRSRRAPSLLVGEGRRAAASG